MELADPLGTRALRLGRGQGHPGQFLTKRQAKDLFSAQARAYARYRPSYPPELFDFIASLPRERRLAWDCATGNGQAALGLAAHFDRVVATDLSASQLALAAPHPRVTYLAAPACRSPLKDGSADLVTAASAAHWFDLDDFYAQVRRVLKPGGAIALWCYGHERRLTPSLDPLMRRYAKEIVGPYWEPEIRYVWEEYKTLPFPFKEVAAPAFELRMSWTLDELLGYFSSWSSTQKYIKAKGENPLALIETDLRAAWGNPERREAIVWDIHLRAGRLR